MTERDRFDTHELASQYPQGVELSDGSRVELRLMTRGDSAALLAFARGLPQEDLLFLRVDLTEPEVVDAWVTNVEEGRTFALVAYRGDEFVGYAAVHRNPAPWMRRIGELRVNVAPAVRAHGLGRLLTSRIFDAASELGLKKLVGQMTTDQQGAQAAFRRLGFVPEALLADFVEDRNGASRDLVIMTFDLEGLTDQAGAPLRI